SGFKEAVRNLILSILSQLENKLHYGKRSVLPTVEIYLEFLFKDILQKFTSYSVVAESSSKINNACDTTSNDITIGSAIKASEAKLTFSFYCRKLKDYVYDSTLRYLPFVYVSACSIHASFHEHLVRVLWDSFKLDHSIASLHWLVSLVCDCNLVQLPLVKDVMRHLSLFLCKLMKSRAAMFSAATASVARSTSVTSYINLNGHDSRGANSGKVDASTASSSEQFVAKQDFVFAFYALLELLIQFEWELMDSDAGVAFVKSLRMDKFICCELQPLAFLPTELLEQFASLAAKHSTIFPNIRLFISVSPKISPDERKDLKVTRQRPFQVKFDLEKCKWAVEPYLRVPIMSSENRVFDDEDSRMSYDLESNCSSSVVGESECSEHRMDNSCDAEMADELALYSSFNSAASKAISDWLI
ncbi:uncharacterized protein LOC142355599, partial [Convolutriloba macropyga]|uniref:uncharacterized protein LOC142355599 n=1 Tax=Convolutriloba macropyga TaxID=536237 RepID=UPI003F521BDD